jgi:hypothetical protein
MSDDRVIAIALAIVWLFSLIIGLFFVEDKFAIFMAGVVCCMSMMLALSLWSINGRGRR